MQLDMLSPTASTSVMEHLDPFVAFVDGDGTVHDRRTCRNGRVPKDLQSAASLRAVLSPPVLREWLGVIRRTITEQRQHSALAILDGIAHEFVAVPQPITHNGITVSTAVVGLLNPHTDGNGHANGTAATPRSTRVTMCSHEWGPLEDLTRCQLDTLRRVSQGLSNDEIARSIFRTKRAVEWHIRFLNETLQVRGRERLGMIGRDAGLHLFGDHEWPQVVKTRPARRTQLTPPIEEAAQVA
jgi:DNA-binding CsgD family transcriptional regulator